MFKKKKDTFNVLNPDVQFIITSMKALPGEASWYKKKHKNIFMESLSSSIFFLCIFKVTTKHWMILSGRTKHSIQWAENVHEFSIF